MPESVGATKGKALVNLVQLEEGERIRAILPVRKFPDEEGKQFVVTCTKLGTVKKTDLTQYSNPRQNGLIACGIDEGDELIAAHVTNGANSLMIATRNGMAIRFDESDVRTMGRAATGVKGIELEEGDQVVSMEVLEPGTSILTVTEKGFGKRTEENEYRTQNRGGKGIITIKTTDRNGPVVGTHQVHARDEVMIVTSGGTLIRTRAEEISIIGRNTQGVRLITVDEGDRVVGVARIAEREEDPSTVELERAGLQVEGAEAAAPSVETPAEEPATADSEPKKDDEN